VGEFEYLEGFANSLGSDKIQCRVYTLRGKSMLGEFALGMLQKVLEYFANYYGIAYPLAKLDMLAIPDLSFGAMENWGLVTYRESLLLYDAGKSSAFSKLHIAYTVAHEIAHQWFGNIVTMGIFC
jgi:aminopeptidase 2